MKFWKTASLMFAATLTVSGLAAMNPMAAQAEVTFESMLKENGGDLDRTHWAATAVQELVDKYHIMSGFPDKKFKGDKQTTRYEIAASLYQVMKYLDKYVVDEVSKLNNKLSGLDKFATKDDLKTIAALQMEFKKELEKIKGEHDKLAKKVDMMSRIQVHGSVEVRYRDRVAVADGTNPASPLYNTANTSATQFGQLERTADTNIPRREKDTGSGTAITADPGTVNASGVREFSPTTTSKTYGNNNGQAVRDGSGLPQTFNDPNTANLTVDDLAPFRVRSNLNVTAMLTDGMKAHTSFDVYDRKLKNGGHNANEGNADGDQFVIRDAYMDLSNKDDKGMGSSFKFGLMNFKSSVNPGTAIKNSFGDSNWVGHGYGFVGYGSSEAALTSGFVRSNAKDATITNDLGAVIAKTNNHEYRNSVSRYWVGGINASQVDPDSQPQNMVTAPSVSFDTEWGWGKFMVGMNYGAVQSNRAAAAAGNLGGGATSGADRLLKNASNEESALYAASVLGGTDRRPLDLTTSTVAATELANLNTAGKVKTENGRTYVDDKEVFMNNADGSVQTLNNSKRLVNNNIALPSQYGDGYGVLGLEFNFMKETFPLRLGLHAMSYLNDNVLEFSKPTRKEVSAVVDLGKSDGFGATLQVNKSFSGYDRHSLGLMFNNIAGKGFDVQLGATLATRGLFGVTDLARGSAGLVLGIPLISATEQNKQSLKLLIAARQTFGDGAFGLPTNDAKDRDGNVGETVNNLEANLANGNANTLQMPDAANTGRTPNVYNSIGIPMMKDAGITVSLPFNNINNTPLSVRAEYSMLMADALWSFKPVAHDLSIVTSYMF